MEGCRRACPTLIEEDDRWNIYAGDNLEDSFGGYEEAALYLREEGFRRR